MDTAGGDGGGAPPSGVVKQEDAAVVDLTEDDENTGGLTSPPPMTTLPSLVVGDLTLQELMKLCSSNPSGNLTEAALEEVSRLYRVEKQVLINSWFKFQSTRLPPTLDSAHGRTLQPDGVQPSPICNASKRKSEAAASSPAAQKPRVVSSFHSMAPLALTPQSGPPVQLKIEDGDKKPKGLPVPKRVSLPAPDSVVSGRDDNGYVDLSTEQSDDEEFVDSSSVSAPIAGVTNLPNHTGQIRNSLGVVVPMQPTSNYRQAHPNAATSRDLMTRVTPTQTQYERRLLKQMATSLTYPAFHSSTSTFLNSATQSGGQRVEKSASVAYPLPRSYRRLSVSPQSLTSKSKSSATVAPLARNGKHVRATMTKQSRSIVCNAILDRCTPNGRLEDDDALREIARHYQLCIDTLYRMWWRILASVLATGAVDLAFKGPEPWTSAGRHINEAYAALSKVLAQRNLASMGSVHSNAGPPAPTTMMNQAVRRFSSPQARELQSIPPECTGQQAVLGSADESASIIKGEKKPATGILQRSGRHGCHA
jgi:hypothetical protein